MALIITRTPLRITLGGGGTDLPSYSDKHGGMCISAAIDKYVYVSVLRMFQEGISLKYSELEKVITVKDIRHPIIKECLKLANLKTPQIEVSSMADIPAGTGLGSSSSFTVGLLKALHSHLNWTYSARDVARVACEIEIDKLGNPIGKQDQYIASYGGIKVLYFHKDGVVEIVKPNISFDHIIDLEENLCLFFTGFSRDAKTVLKEQKTESLKDDTAMISSLDITKDLAMETLRLFENKNSDMRKYGDILNTHWINKKTRSDNMSNNRIDEWYQVGLDNGAIGGKLVGAGGGGFLMFYAGDKRKLRQAMKKQGLEEVRFRFDFDGSKAL